MIRIGLLVSPRNGWSLIAWQTTFYICHSPHSHSLAWINRLFSHKIRGRIMWPLSIILFFIFFICVAHNFPFDLIEKQPFHTIAFAIWAISKIQMENRKRCRFHLIVDLFIFSKCFSVPELNATLFRAQYCGWWCKEYCVWPKCRLLFMEWYISCQF